MSEPQHEGKLQVDYRFAVPGGIGSLLALFGVFTTESISVLWVSVAVLTVAMYTLRYGLDSVLRGKSMDWKIRNFLGMSATAAGVSGLAAVDRFSTQVSGIGNWPDGVIWTLWMYAAATTIVTVVWGAFQWGKNTKQVRVVDGGLVEVERVDKPLPSWQKPVGVRLLVIAVWYIVLLLVTFAAVYRYAWLQEDGESGGVFETVAMLCWFMSAGWAFFVYLPRRALPRFMLAVAVMILPAAIAFSVVSSTAYDAGRDAWRAEADARDIADGVSGGIDISPLLSPEPGEEYDTMPVPSKEPSAPVDYSDVPVYTFSGIEDAIQFPAGTVFRLEGLPEGWSAWDGQCVMAVEGQVGLYKLLETCGSGYLLIFPSEDKFDYYEFVDSGGVRVEVSPS